MKLGEMGFEESKNAELVIIPEIEKIWADEKTTEALNIAFSGKTYMQRGKAQRTLLTRLVCYHFDPICKILSILNNVDIDEVKGWKRSDVNEKLAEMFKDPDMSGFFIPSETLDEAVQSVIS